MKTLSNLVVIFLVVVLTGCGTRGGFMAVETKFGDPNSAYSSSATEKSAGRSSASANSKTKTKTVVRRQSGNGFHHVKQGETLYSIAWAYGLDYREVASANSIYSPYTIYPGQRIDVSGARRVASASSSVRPTTPASQPTASTSPAVVSAAAVEYTPPPKPVAKEEAWKWPASGRLIGRFSTTNPVNKGIDIDGALGDAVLATSAGTVVYAGQGLRGYGNLVIIKHNDTYLSAYAHANKILVKEQENVAVGQKIAEIGSTGTTSNKLHFEIRQNGKPVDPLQFLPKK